MKRLDVLAWILVVVLGVAAFFERTGRQDAGREVTRLTRLSDSLANQSARTDTIYSVDTATFTRWRTVRDTLRDSLTLTDTVEVVRFIAVQDSTIAACSAALLTCEQRVSLRDQRILILSDSLPREVAKQWRGKVTTARQRSLTVGVVAGALAALLLAR